MIIISILLVIIVILLVILSFVWPPDSPWAPQWRTSRNVARDLLKFADIKEEDVVYELGSGDGEVILSAVKDFGARSVGIEIDPIRAFISICRVKAKRLSSSVTVIRKDFKSVDLSPATIVYMYLVPAGMKRLLPKLKNELASGTRIVSYRYKIPLEKDEKQILLVKKDMKNKIYLYVLKTMK